MSEERGTKIELEGYDGFFWRRGLETLIEKVHVEGKRRKRTENSPKSEDELPFEWK
jgi:hypothetical protein